MTIDSELHTLQEKVKRLTHDRDVAMKMATRSEQMFKEMKAEMENYRKLWQHAESRKHGPLPFIDYDPYIYDEVPGLVFPEKKKRTINDWIWTGVWLAAASAVVYILGWVLVWP